jgi:hypothetical protein
MSDDDDLRALGPAGLTPERHAALRRAVLDEITATPGDVAPPTGPPRSTPGRARWWIAAAALLAIGAIAALVATRDQPTSNRTASATTSTTLSVDLPADWRPELTAERVQCIRRPRSLVNAFEAQASQVPLDDDLAPDDPYLACEALVVRPGNARGPLGTETCRDPASSFPTPIVLLGLDTCPDRGLVPLDDDDLAVLDDARRTEARLLAITATCASRELAARWVEQELEATGADLSLVTRPGADEAEDACFGPVVSWPDATVTIELVPTR